MIIQHLVDFSGKQSVRLFKWYNIGSNKHKEIMIITSSRQRIGTVCIDTCNTSLNKTFYLTAINARGMCGLV